MLVGEGELLRGLHLQEGRRPTRIGDAWKRAEEPFAWTRDQLGEYFAGERVKLSFPASA